jgi:hypothetical protein
MFSRSTSPALVQKIIDAAVKMFQNEQKRIKKGGKDEAKIFVEQLTSKSDISLCEAAYDLSAEYMYHEAPFNKPETNLAQRYYWWSKKASDSGAALLAVCIHFVIYSHSRWELIQS